MDQTRPGGCIQLASVMNLLTTERTLCVGDTSAAYFNRTAEYGMRYIRKTRTKLTALVDVSWRNDFWKGRQDRLQLMMLYGNTVQTATKMVQNKSFSVLSRWNIWLFQKPKNNNIGMEWAD